MLILIVTPPSNFTHQPVKPPTAVWCIYGEKRQQLRSLFFFQVIFPTISDRYCCGPIIFQTFFFLYFFVAFNFVFGPYFVRRLFYPMPFYFSAIVRFFVLFNGSVSFVEGLRDLLCKSPVLSSNATTTTNPVTELHPFDTLI